MTALGACPHCGKSDMVYIKCRAYGWATQLYTEDGDIGDMSIEGVRYTDSHTVRCAGCGEARNDLAFADQEHRRIIRR